MDKGWSFPKITKLIRSHFALEAHFNQAKFHLTILQLWSANVHIETMKLIPKQLTIYNIN